VGRKGKSIERILSRIIWKRILRGSARGMMRMRMMTIRSLIVLH
jgi:hypothetical protein